MGFNFFFFLAGFFTGFPELSRESIFHLDLDILLNALLIHQLPALNVEDLGHKLGLGLCQIQALLGELEAILFVEVAQFAQGEINLLERVNCGILHNCMLHLLNLTEKLDKHLLAKLLACHFVVLLDFFTFRVDYLLEFRNDFLDERIFAYKLTF